MDSILTNYKNYQIYQDYITGKYGIRDTDIDTTVIKCVFDNLLSPNSTHKVTTV